MKVTEYLRTQRAWQPVREYYQFRSTQDVTDPAHDKRAEPCPGCGRKMRPLALQAHECMGGAEAWPRLPNQRRSRLQKIDPDLVREYIRTRRHHTVSTDE